MRNYLSFGGGVNSVALHLMLLDQGVDFESVFVHHGTDWPETYQYVAGFQWWLKANGHKPITVLRPKVRTKDGIVFENLYNYYAYTKTIPTRISRACTDRFKVTTLQKYFVTPCFCYIGIDADEAHRAKPSYKKGIEIRWPLIEHEIGRAGCIEIIKNNGLPVLPKSGCYICPFMRRSEYQRLRRQEPGLFCAAQKLESEVTKKRILAGKSPLFSRDIKLESYICESQTSMLAEDVYPPCQCEL